MRPHKQELPRGWLWEKIGSLCQVYGGGTPSRKIDRYFRGSIPWATPTDVTALKSLEIWDTATKITEEAISKSAARLLAPGCVLLTTRATIGFTAINPVPMCTNQGFANLDCGPRVLNYYLAYYLSSIKETLLNLAGGSIYREISKSTLKEIEIPLPPLPVQERIVQILQKAYEIRRKRREALELADNTLLALFLDMFGDPVANPKGWPRVQLGELIGDWQNGFATGNKEVEGGIPQVRMQNITTRGWFDKTLVRTVSQHQNHKRYLLQEGDVLFNNTNSPELVGKTAIFREQGQWYLSNHISRLRPTEGVTGEYLWGLLVLLWVRGTFRSMCRQWVNQASISRDELLKIQVPIPPERVLQCHKQAVQQLEAVREKLLAFEAQASATFQSLLTRAFTGELTAEWEAANAEEIAAQQAFHERLPRLLVLALLAEKAKRASRAAAEVLVTALMKYVFLLQMEGNGGRRRLYHFVPYHYGPFAKELYADLKKLQEEGLVTVDNDAEEEKTRIALADLKRAERALAELPDDLKEDVATIIKNYGNLDHNSLLKRVYEKYPAYARKSRLKRKTRSS
jgi:type I restriction enzyme S subunit